LAATFILSQFLSNLSGDSRSSSHPVVNDTWYVGTYVSRIHANTWIRTNYTWIRIRITPWNLNWAQLRPNWVGGHESGIVGFLLMHTTTWRGQLPYLTPCPTLKSGIKEKLKFLIRNFFVPANCHEFQPPHHVSSILPAFLGRLGCDAQTCQVSSATPLGKGS
jgi:hypothetical protein